MSFDFGSALDGGIEGAKYGSMTGNPYIAIAAALGDAAVRGFSGKKKSKSSGGGGGSFGDLIPGGDVAGGEGGGFSTKMVSDILSSVMGGGGQPAADGGPEKNPLLQGQGTTTMAPQLMGFPSLSKMNTRASLRQALAASRGF